MLLKEKLNTNKLILRIKKKIYILYFYFHI